MNEIFEALSNVIKAVTGIDEVIFANPNKNSPKGEYATILIAQSVYPTSMGTLKKKVSEDNMSVEITNRYPVTWDCTVNFWRGNAVENATKLVRAQYLPVASDSLLEKGIGWVGCSNVINLTALQSSNFEQRAVVTVTLTTYEEVKQTVNTILSAEMQVENENGNVIQKFSTQGKI